jgi:uncharacterized protein (TIGR03083 family)
MSHNQITIAEPTTETWIRALRASVDRFTSLLTPLDGTAIRARSYDTDWSIAQVASHLGSQAEIFGLFLEAGLTGGELPGSEQFQAIWSRWDSSSPEQQVARSLETNEAFMSRVEGLSYEQRDAFHANLFGNRSDLAGFLASRLSEHAVHTWDMAVALDQAAMVSGDAVTLLTDTTLTRTAGRGTKPTDPPLVIAVSTTEPDRSFVLTTGPQVSLVLADDDSREGAGGATSPTASDYSLTIPAEALLRLVFGRLDADHSPSVPADQEELLARLRKVFLGF